MGNRDYLYTICRSSRCLHWRKNFLFHGGHFSDSTGATIASTFATTVRVSVDVVYDDVCLLVDHHSILSAVRDPGQLQIPTGDRHNGAAGCVWPDGSRH